LLGGELSHGTEVPFFIPKIIEEKCTKCGLCSKNCATHALLHIPDAYPIPMLTVCSGCKLCYKICPEKAIEADSKILGWTYSEEMRGISLSLGELRPSEARSAGIVEVLLEKLDNVLENNPEIYDIIILDTAPGAHCDVELLIGKADLVIPITEPTKFGELDLLRIIELIELMNKEYKVVVNRSSLLGFRDEFLRQLEEKNINILGDIPLDDDIVSSYCQGIPIMDKKCEYKGGEGYNAFEKIFNDLKIWLKMDKPKEGK